MPQNLAVSLKYPIKIEKGRLKPIVTFREIKVIRENELVKVAEERSEGNVVKIVGKRFRIISR